MRSACTGEPYLKAGEPIRVRVKFNSYKPVEFVRFRIGIQDSATQTLITLANIDATNLDKGGEIICTFPEIHLHPRTYSIYLSATDLLMLYERQSNATIFVVDGARDEDIKFSIGDPQLIHLPHSIELNFNNNSNTH